MTVLTDTCPPETEMLYGKSAVLYHPPHSVLYIATFTMFPYFSCSPVLFLIRLMRKKQGGGDGRETGTMRRIRDSKNEVPMKMFFLQRRWAENMDNLHDRKWKLLINIRKF